ncbi:ImmA/IrrE family metallo-endopeptidase [Clostridium baratii]|uniref:ImmA/IrrE family metallo-endopeptidase n=1 Tax=Clostridium baratii TaxID=1561 RepID=UPI00097FB003|nr:ImmA/IrrE family metallo-endopeptidase [Clostridium baratii]AQM60407.1 hypothetical protein NPD11_456 [Clostridium baratii]
MTKYENLVIEAHKQGAKVVEIDLGTTTPCGKCIDNIIIINNRIKDSEKYCILAEELGHYKLTVGNILDTKKINNKKQELLARKWGYEKNVGIIGIINAFEYGCVNKHEIAEFLGVTETYLNEAIDYFYHKYGDGCKIDNYYITFYNGIQITKAF